MDVYHTILTHLDTHSGFASRKALADEIGIHRTALSRYLSQKRPVSKKDKALIAQFLQQPNFTISRSSESEVKTIVDEFLSERANRQQKQTKNFDSFKYFGNYDLYYPSEHKDRVVVSKLTIGKHSVSLLNPFIEDDGSLNFFRYDGALEVRGEFFYLSLQQQHHTYKILNFAFLAPFRPRSSVLRGAMLGIGVNDQFKAIATKEVLAIISNRVSLEEDIQAKDCFIDAAKAPKIVNKILNLPNKFVVFPEDL